MPWSRRNSGSEPRHYSISMNVTKLASYGFKCVDKIGKERKWCMYSRWELICTGLEEKPRDLGPFNPLHICFISTPGRTVAQYFCIRGWSISLRIFERMSGFPMIVHVTRPTLSWLGTKIGEYSRCQPFKFVEHKWMPSALQFETNVAP